LSLDEPDITQRLAIVEDRIRRAAERRARPRSDITLVAVSKKFSAAHLRAAYGAGLREFGENYIQEFAEKRPELNDLEDASYHLIGHLQSNKARLACQLFDVVQTADSPKLLGRLEAAAAESAAKLEVMIEVKLSSEESKSGAAPGDLPALLDGAWRAGLPSRNSRWECPAIWK
jgi:pyridoxal phosphate enzyme (YggS family)